MRALSGSSLNLIFLLCLFGCITGIRAEYRCPNGYQVHEDGRCYPLYSLSPSIASRPERFGVGPYQDEPKAARAGASIRGGNENEEESLFEENYAGQEDAVYDEEDDEVAGEELDNQTLHDRMVLVCFPNDGISSTMCAETERRLTACGIKVMRYNFHTGAQLAEQLRNISPPLPRKTLAIVAGHGGNDARGVHFMAGAYQTWEIAEGLASVMDMPQVYVTACNSGGAFSTLSDRYNLATSSRSTEYTNYQQDLGWLDPATNVILNVMCDSRWFDSLKGNSLTNNPASVDGHGLTAQLSVTPKLQIPQFSANFELIPPHAERNLLDQPRLRGRSRDFIDDLANQELHI